MANYTQISKSDLRKIIREYGMIYFSEFTSIDGGNANSSFLITTENGKYVLTILEEKNFSQANDLAMVLEWLKTYNFFTSTICLTESGHLIAQYEQKPIILKKWIPGGIIKDLSINMLKEAGHSLAKLHLIPVPNFLPKEHAYGVQTFSTIVDKGLDVEYETWLKGQLLRIEKKIPKNLPKGLIHGDLFYDNIIFDKDKIKAIIDFEEACFYFLIFDIGMSLVGLCRDDENINLAKVKSFIKGYEEIRQLESIEKEYLKFFIEYAAIATSKWRYWKYNFDAPSNNLKNKHWEMVSTSKQVRSIINSSFLTTIFE